jgi:cytochrome d ubiquinol oxidase subunit II
VSLPEVAALLMVIGLTAYAVLGGADFGVGFWDLTAGRDEGGVAMRRQIRASMGPVWEANHVWLIFVLVVFWTAFPEAFGSVMSTLYIPLFLVAVGIIMRGGAFAFRDRISGRAGALVGPAFGLSSIVTPFFMGTIIGAIITGRIPLGNAAGDPVTSWWNPVSILIGVLSVVTGAFLAAVFLCGDSGAAGAGGLADRFRVRALASGVLAGALALGAVPLLRDDAEVVHEGLTSWPGAAFVVLSALGGVATLALLAVRRFEAARIPAAIAVGAIVLGWGVAQSPELLVGAVTIEDAAAPDVTLRAMLWSIAGGLVLLLPSLAILYWLTLTGGLDERRRLERPPGDRT